MSHPTLSPKINLQELFEKPDPALWRELTEKVLGGAPFEKKVVTRTLEGIALQPVYDRTAVEGQASTDTTPGEFPYLRSTAPEGFTSEAWEICQSLCYPTPESFNEAVVHDVSRGQNAVLLQLDENGRKGVDPEGTAGVGGTCITSEADLEVALKGLNLKEVSLHIEAGAAAPALAAALNHSELAPGSGSVCFDPLALLATDGFLPMTLSDAWDVLAKMVTWADKEMPEMSTVGVDVSWNVNAGGNAVGDLALMLASAAETFRALAERGVPVSLAASKALVRFSIGADTFMEVAKFRAARGLWAHLVSSCGGEGDACKLKQFAATSSWHQTKLDPYVNLLRATSQAFSAVLGGVDGLRVDPFDAPFGLPNTTSRRIARNIQLVLRDEAHLTEVVDPAGGSWTVEHLTQELSARAWAKFQEIEKAGGLAAVLRDGSLQSELKEQANKQVTLLAQRRMVKVGSNQFAYPDEPKTPERQPDTQQTAVDAQAKLNALKETRDGTSVTQALATLKQDQSMDALEVALKQGATLSEVMQVLGSSESTRVNPVELGRLTLGYEKLRMNMEQFIAENGQAPMVFMAHMGPVRQHKVRSDFSQEFLKPGGFNLKADQQFDTAEAAAQAVVDSGAAATVLCSTDDTYPDLVPAFAQAVKAASPRTVVLMAGMMPDHLEEFKAAGVDAFIHLKANNLDLLSDLQNLTGVSS